MTEREIFLALLELPDPEDRSRYLDQFCDDPARRARLEALLQSHESADSFLDNPAVDLSKPNGATQDLGVARSQPVQAQTVALNTDHAMANNKMTDDDSDDLNFLSPATRPDSLGRLGHYEMLELLGKGGFGIVFRAFDETLQRVVAIKVMAPQIATLSPARKRFLREARSSAQVRHENVVQVYEIGEQPLPYLAMEFIPGETLQQRLNRTGPLEVSEILRIGRQIAEGLAAAHTCDLIHRDIKPGNILLEAGTHKSKITDFGLARAADDASISQSGIIAGTPMYMAPEQALGEKIDQRADLFSLGSVLYQMASGRPPFRANSTVAVLKRVAEDTPRDIKEITPETPQWLCDIIARLHAKNPDERFQSAREVADILADCEAQLKENAKLKDFSRIPRRAQQATTRSRRWMWTTAAVAILLPAITLAVSEISGVTHLFRSPTAAGLIAERGQPVQSTDAPPEMRVALEFDGIKDCVATPLLYDGSTPLTVEATVQISEWPVNKKNYHAEIVGCTQQAGFGLGTSKEGFYLSAFIGTNYSTVYSPRDDRYLNRPIKLAGIIDDHALRLFIDGKQVARSGFEHAFKPSKERISLGTSPGNGMPNDGGGYDWPGKMFEVRISNTARYKGDYNAGAPLTADGNTLLLYRCDEGSGDVLHDTSGNGRHGQIIGARWVKATGPAVSPTVPAPSTFTNSLGMEFVLVPKGKSWLGGSKDKLGDKEVEIPADFYLGKYEVTQEEWEAVMGENPSWFSRTGNGKDAVKDIPDADLKLFPVEHVSWDQCQVFVAKLNQREKETGWAYRLPKEAEWEYACRGGPMADRADSAFDFYFAQPTNSVSVKRANFDFGEGLKRTSKVGSYEANCLGLFDMHGNVWEWCDDAVKATESGTERRTRSCGWQSNADECRAVNRGSNLPSFINYHLGIRLARVPSGVPAPVVKTPPLPVAPFTDADVKRIAALPAEQQVEEVRKELVRRNPGFDGTVGHKIEEGVVTEIKVVTDKVTDIAPIRVFNSLRVLSFSGTYTEKSNGQLADLTALRGMNLESLTQLNLGCSKVTDAGMVYFKDCKDLTALYLDGARVSDRGMAYFKDCKNLASLRLDATQVSDAGLMHFQDCKNLAYLNLSWTQVSDAGLVHFQDCKDLTRLSLAGTKVSDVGLAQFKDCKNLTHLEFNHLQVGDAGLAHFKGMPLKSLWINNTGITDLNPLQGMPLEDIRLTPKNIARGLEILRDMKSLKTIGISFDQSWPAAEFWERYDKGEFGKAFTDADVKRIAALPAAEQVEEVRKELMRRNPGFDGKMETRIEEGVVTEFKIVVDKVSDIAPIRVFNSLRVLDCRGTWTNGPNGKLADLSPLEGMNLAALTHLTLHQTKVTDASLVYFKDSKQLRHLNLSGMQVTGSGLANFKDCKNLTDFVAYGTPLSDAGLVHLQNCQELTFLHLGNTKVSDVGLAHFKNCKNLTHLTLTGTLVSDKCLTNVKDYKVLNHLSIGHTHVSDAGLASLKGMPLKMVGIYNTGIADLTPLQGMPLEEIFLTPKTITRGLDILRDMKSLKTIGIEWNQSWPAAEFWERYDRGEFGKAFTDEDVKRIAALPAAEQVEEVRKELMRRNPGFDGKVEHKIEDGVVTEFRIVTDQVTDIAPIRVFDSLRVLDLWGTKVSDAGLPRFKDYKDLRWLKLRGTQVTDSGLTQLKDCPNLIELDVSATRVGDMGMASLKDCKNLKGLVLVETQVTDAGLQLLKGHESLSILYLGDNPQVSNTGLAHLKDMLLTRLDIYNTGINDLNGLEGMPLEDVRLTPKNITRGLEILREMKSLKTIGVEWNQSWSAAEFWQRYDKGEFTRAFTDADVKRIAALPAAEQVEEVRKELMKRNPGFDGKIEHKVEDGVVTEFRIVTDQVTDIAPIRVLNALRVLDLVGTEVDGQIKGQLADLGPLKGMNLSSLTNLSVARNAKIDDAGLVHFKTCKNLTGLWLNQTLVTNAGMANFEGCKRLQRLNLKYTKVDDAGLALFKDCKDLIGLDLGGLQVTDQGLANFKDCKEITDLWLNNTQVTDDGLGYFKDRKNLTILHAGGTQVTDAGLVHLKGCKQLTTLFLGYTKITNAGLLNLTGLDRLTLLNLDKSQVTAKGVEDLAKSLPKCKITWDGVVIEPK